MNNYLALGNWNALCDVCGRKYKASELKRRWDGLMTCSEDYETRHPSDFIKVPTEKITVPWSRPEPTDTFVSHVCTMPGSTAYAEYAMADCAITGNNPSLSVVVDVYAMYPAIAGYAIAGASVSGWTGY